MLSKLLLRKTSASNELGSPVPLAYPSVVMLHGDGTNGSQTILNAVVESAQYPVTALGSAALSTARSKFGKSSIYCPGDPNSYLMVPNSAGVSDFSAVDVTIDFWLYLPSLAITTAGNHIIGGSKASGGATYEWMLYAYPNGKVAIGVAGTNEIVSGAGVLVANTWMHIAVVKSGSTTKIYKDGVVVASGTAAVWNASTSDLYIGGCPNVTYYGYMAQYIDELRIDKTRARWLENFTVPTEAYTGSDLAAKLPPPTSLMLHGDGSGQIFDSITAPHSITANGVVVSAAQSKFGGSSLYFNGAGTLSIPNSTDHTFGADDFTVDCWCYPTASSPQASLIGRWAPGAYEWVLLMSNDSNRCLRFITCTDGSTVFTDYVSSASLPLNTWSHLAVVRRGTTLTLYLNGTQVLTAAATTSFYSSQNTLLGMANSGQYFQGYLDEVRIVKGQALWTTNFSVPTVAYGDALDLNGNGNSHSLVSTPANAIGYTPYVGPYSPAYAFQGQQIVIESNVGGWVGQQNLAAGVPIKEVKWTNYPLAIDICSAYHFQYRPNAAAAWTTIQTVTGISPNVSEEISIDIQNYMAPNEPYEFRILQAASTNGDGWWAMLNLRFYA